MKISIIGIGGHAKVVFESLLGTGVKPHQITLRDKENRKLDHVFEGCKLETPELPETMKGEGFHVTIGDNTVRQQLHSAATILGATGYSVIDLHAHVSPTATIGDACFAACGSIVAAKSAIGQGTILNHNCVVDHDCNIGEFCHIAPGAVLGGGVHAGDRALVGAGAVVLPGIAIGKDVVIGAGSVVTRPIADNKTWIGNALAP